MDLPTTATIPTLEGQQWREKLMNGGRPTGEQIDEVAKQFESILIRQFLDEALKPMSEEAGLFGGKSHPMRDQMIKDALAQSIVQNQSLGFSSVLQAQLHPEPYDISKSNEPINE